MTRKLLLEGAKAVISLPNDRWKAESVKIKHGIFSTKKNPTSYGIEITIPNEDLPNPIEDFLNKVAVKSQNADSIGYWISEFNENKLSFVGYTRSWDAHLDEELGWCEGGSSISRVICTLSEIDDSPSIVGDSQ